MMRTLLGVALLIAAPSLVEAADAHAAAKKLGRGINFGNVLEAPKEGEWGLTLQPEYFEAVKSAGFDSVRIPIKWSAHAESKPPYAIDPKFFERIDWAIDQALSRGLNAVINVHHFDGMDSDPDRFEPELIALWTQIAARYKDRPDSLYFELDNEPHDKLTDERWNRAIGPVLAAVRKTNPTRMVIIGPGHWNNWRNLEKLQLPESDRNLIATFHYYEPFEFTHQGAEWAKGSEKWLGRTWTGSDKEMKDLRTAFDTVAAWGKKHDRPIYLGEFGCYSKADMDSRLRWTKAVVSEVAKRDFATAYWEFGSGFGAYDPAKHEWRESLKDALVGRSRSGTR